MINLKQPNHKTMPITVAREKDIPFMVSLMDTAYRGEQSKNGWTSEADLFIGNKRTDEDEVHRLMLKPGAVFLLFKNDTGEIAGNVFLDKKEDRLYLGMLSVSPNTQGIGIGKKLLNAAEQFAKENHCRVIYMTVISIRHELISWYERHGYKQTGEKIPFPFDERFGIPTQPLDMLILEKEFF